MKNLMRKLGVGALITAGALYLGACGDNDHSSMRLKGRDYVGTIELVIQEKLPDGREYKIFKLTPENVREHPYAIVSIENGEQKRFVTPYGIGPVKIKCEPQGTQMDYSCNFDPENIFIKREDALGREIKLYLDENKGKIMGISDRITNVLNTSAPHLWLSK